MQILHEEDAAAPKADGTALQDSEFIIQFCLPRLSNIHIIQFSCPCHGCSLQHTKIYKSMIGSVGFANANPKP